MSAASWILVALALYAGIGVAVSAAFVTVGVSRVDPAAAGAPWGFRMLIAPGAAALWPMILSRWALAGKTPEEHA